jgi:acyl-CoA dehydrogenase
MGVVLARISDGPLGMRALLLTPENLLNQHNIKKRLLNTVALRGACLSCLEMNQLKINRDQILGQHLSSIQSGMMAVITTFNRMRPGVAAIALGHAQAQFDYTVSHAKQMSRTQQINCDALLCKLKMSRQNLHKTALQVEKNPLEQSQSSAIKLLTTQLAEEVSTMSLNYFGKSLFLEHPILVKWIKDVHGFEFMEGTTNIHLLNIFKNYQQKHRNISRCLHADTL